MGKVKAVLAVVKKHHFWVMVGLVAALGLSMYVLAAADLKGQYTARQKKLDDAVKSVGGISTGEHPNEKSLEVWKAARDAQRKKVFEGWKMLYDKQQKENPWPQDVLSKRFHLMIRDRKPDQEMPAWAREEYQNYIQQYVPTLFSIVDYRHLVPVTPEGAPAAPGAAPGLPTMGGEAGMGAAGANANFKTVGIVDVNPAEWTRIMGDLNFVQRPTTKQVLCAQEDLWVYEALLNIIKRANTGTTTQSTAAVKQIHFIQIGRAAAYLISPGQTAGAAGGGGGEMGMGAPSMGAGGMGAGGGPSLSLSTGAGGGAGPAMSGSGVSGPGMMGPSPGMMGPEGGGAAPTSIDEMLLQGRYVGEQLQPLNTAEEAPYAEFNMMPVRLVLLVDGRKIPEILVECANSTMPVEVKMLRVSASPAARVGTNPGGVGGGMDMGGMGAMGAPSMGAMGGPSMMGGERGGGVAGLMGGGEQGMGRGEPGMGPTMGPAAMGPAGMAPAGMGNLGMAPGGLGGLGGGLSLGGTGGTDPSGSVDPYAVPLEIHGIIYIYKKPDEEKLATGKQATDAVAEATGQAPAAEPTTGPAPSTGPAPAGPPSAPAASGPVVPAGPALPGPAPAVPTPAGAAPVAPTPAAPTPAPVAPGPAAPAAPAGPAVPAPAAAPASAPAKST